jgi:hypothetical protein
MTDDERGYLPYLRALILLQCSNRNNCFDSHPAAILRHAGFTVEEVAELCDMKIAAVAKAISRARKKKS